MPCNTPDFFAIMAIVVRNDLGSGPRIVTLQRPKNGPLLLCDIPTLFTNPNDVISCTVEAEGNHMLTFFEQSLHNISPSLTTYVVICTDGESVPYNLDPENDLLLVAKAVKRVDELFLPNPTPQ